MHVKIVAGKDVMLEVDAIVRLWCGRSRMCLEVNVSAGTGCPQKPYDHRIKYLGNVCFLPYAKATDMSASLFKYAFLSVSPLSINPRINILEFLEVYPRLTFNFEELDATLDAMVAKCEAEERESGLGPCLMNTHIGLKSDVSTVVEDILIEFLDVSMEALVTLAEVEDAEQTFIDPGSDVQNNVA